MPRSATCRATAQPVFGMIWHEVAQCVQPTGKSVTWHRHCAMRCCKEQHVCSCKPSQLQQIEQDTDICRECAQHQGALRKPAVVQPCRTLVAESTRTQPHDPYNAAAGAAAIDRLCGARQARTLNSLGCLIDQICVHGCATSARPLGHPLLLLRLLLLPTGGPTTPPAPASAPATSAAASISTAAAAAACGAVLQLQL
jgi:hypothetical protein